MKCGRRSIGNRFRKFRGVNLDNLFVAGNPDAAAFTLKLSNMKLNYETYL